MTNPASPNHVVENRCVPAVSSAFGITDAKGREFGMKLRVWTAEVVAGQSPMCEDIACFAHYSTRLEPGTWYACNIHSTRDDETYGASHGDNYFRTEDERHAYISKRRADGVKRAGKRRAVELEKLELKKRCAR